MRTISILTCRRAALGCLAALMLIAAAGLVGCAANQMGEAQPTPSPSSIPLQSSQSTALPLDSSTVQANVSPAVQPTATVFTLGPLIDEGVDLKSGPVEVPIELLVPALKVNAPILGVGLTAQNVMDAPKGPIGDPIWHTAFWYRGGGIPGAPGTSTIAAHVNDPLGRPEIFADLQKMQPGDLIIIHLKSTSMDIVFKVDQVKIYSTAESSDPEVLKQIFGAGPVEGIGPQPSPDGSSHLTLITCAGYIVNGEFDHHTVVFSTRIR